jgi:hypothetical protein
MLEFWWEMEARERRARQWVVAIGVLAVVAIAAAAGWTP